MLDLYCVMYFLEKGKNARSIPKIHNINHMFSVLELTLRDEDYDTSLNVYDRYDYNLTEIVKEKNYNDKLIILNQINSYNVFHNNLVYNYYNIDDLADSYENLSYSIRFLNNNFNNSNLEYYSCLSIIGTTYLLNDYKIYKENFIYRKKKNFNY